MWVRLCLSVILPETAPNFWRFRDWLQKQNQWPSLCSTCSGQASLAACLAGHPHVMFASVTLQVHLTSLSYCNIWPKTFQVLCQSQCKRSSAPSSCGLGPRRSIPADFALPCVWPRPFSRLRRRLRRLAGRLRRPDEGPRRFSDSKALTSIR